MVDAPGRLRQARAAAQAALAAFERWQSLHDPEALRTSLLQWSRALESLPAGSGERPVCLTELGRSLRGWFDLTGDASALDRAVAVSAAAVAEGEALGHAFLDEQLSNLALAYSQRYQTGHRIADIEAAVAAARRSIAATRPDHERLPGRRANLSQMLTAKAVRMQAYEDCEAALGATHEALAALPPGHPLTAVTHVNLAELLRGTFEWTQVPARLDEAIESARAALRLSRSGQPVHAQAWGSLAQGLLLRIEAARANGTPVGTDLDEVVAAARTAVAHGGPDAPLAVLEVLCLASALRLRSQETGDLADLDEAIALCEQLLRSGHHGTEDAAEAQIRDLLLLSLMQRHQRAPDPRDIDSVLRHLEASAGTVQDHDPGLPAALFMRGTAFLTLYEEHTADPATLDEAVDLLTRALSLSTNGSDEAALLRTVLSEALLHRFEDRGNGTDLEEAAALSLRAVREATPDTLPRTLAAHIAVAVLQARGQHTGTGSDFDTAVALAREAVRARGTSPSTKAAMVTGLGNALHSRYEHGGRLEDLNGAIDAKREASQSDLLSTAHRAMYLSGLGSSLLTRFHDSGDVADLTASVAACAEGMELLQPDHPYQDRLLANLSLALQTSHSRHRRPDDLEQAVRYARAAVAATPPESLRLPMNLSNLAIVIHQRFTGSRNPDDLETAVSSVRRAIATTSAGHSDQVKFLSNLCQMLTDRYVLLGRQEDLDEAVDVGRRSVDLCPPDSTSRDGCLLHFGDALQRAGRADEAIEIFREAATRATGIVRLRLVAAKSWGAVAAAQKQWEEALAGYAYAVELLPQAAWHGLERTDREHFLSITNGLASDAAAVAIETGRLAHAVELLEQGRGVLLAQALDARTGLDQLRDLAPELARDLDDVRRRLDNAVTEGADGMARNLSAHQVAVEAQRRRDAAATWDRLLERARLLVPDFLRPRPYAGLRGAARGGPVVIVNIGRHRSDALVVTAEADAPLLVRLERISRPVVNSWTRDLITTFRGPEETTPHQRNDALRSLLAALWNDIAEPVLVALAWPAHPKDDVPPRLWWCPTGSLTMLPLHAAGLCPAPGGDGSPPARTNLLDRAVCSYAPTLRSLLEAGRRPAGTPPQMLGVAVPNADGMTELRHAVPEIGALRERFTGMTAVIGPQATRDTVLACLPSHTWLHFAGHGSSYSLAGGALHCTDHVITLREVTALQLEAAELAFLSACETAGGVASLADEFAHLAGGLHLAGYRHVIATQWSISDLRAPQVARAFYETLADSPQDPDGLLPAAAALHTAIRNLRRSRPDSPALWAPYLHTGP
ncbi:CHAT domain-containing protein [Streptomyces sp. NPDC091371]|uniref:CHAT domain-containing protein n=1 Tax=Streptomyces sp. NPDC091371 TaxID=3155303 RepID=UPI00342E8D3E